MDARIVSEILRRNEQYLRRHLVLSRTVLDKLNQQGLITEIIRRKILMYPSYKQVGVLLESLENRGLPSLRKFLEVLRDTGHGYLVDNILDTEAIPVADVRPGTSKTYTGGRNDIPLRPIHTVQSPRRGAANMVSLGSLMKARHEQQTAPRGSLNPRTLLTDPVMTGYNAGAASVGLDLGGYRGSGGNAAYQGGPYAGRREDVPSTLYNLGQAFNNQQKVNEQALIVLRQEEMAIKQLMEQNARDQQKVRRKQYAMTDLTRKLSDINARASEMYEPGPHPNIGRYRLAQLNQIPWSVDH